MNEATMARVMDQVFEQCKALRAAGQKEYAHNQDNAFANFERIGNQLQEDRKKILLVYALKHWDGIVAYVNGHVSQRESVDGRIGDLITYLCLLQGMIKEERGLT